MKGNISVIAYIALGLVLALVFSDWMFLVVGTSLAVFMKFWGGDVQKGQERTEQRLQERIDARK